MAVTEEILPMEGMWAPLEVRRELRKTFDRWLGSTQNPPLFHEHDAFFDAQNLLTLCQHYRLEYVGSRIDIAESWDLSDERMLDGGPTFEDLKRLGWILFDGGSWVMPRAPNGKNSFITYPSPSTKTFLLGINKLQLVPKMDITPVNIKVYADKLSATICHGHHIPVSDSDFFLSSLWKQICPAPPCQVVIDEGDNDGAEYPRTSGVNVEVKMSDTESEVAYRAFLEWSAWCSLIDGYGRWNTSWSPHEMQSCRTAAYQVLDRQKLWNGWNNDIAGYTSLLEKTFAIPREQLDFRWIKNEESPESLVAKADWLTSNGIEHVMIDRLIMQRDGSCSVSYAFGLLCSELEKTDIGPGINEKVSSLFRFLIDHPMAFQHFILRTRNAPYLLIDMLMHPTTASLAAKLVIEWRNSVRSSDRNMGRDAQTKEFAIQDSLSFLAHHLNENALDLKEYASLITWCFLDNAGTRSANADPRKQVGGQLIGLLVKENAEVQSVVLTHLIEQTAFTNNVPRACFTAVLEGLNSLPKAIHIDRSPVIALYSKFASERNLDWTDVASLSPELAMRLVATAFSLDMSDRDALLIPFESVQLLREASDKDKHSIGYSIAKTMRTHIRLIARAISGWEDETVPSELANAFKVLISRSVIEHDEKGKVGALTDRYSTNHFMGREEGSPAQDIADAWRRLDTTIQKIILQLLLQSDDPVLLAQLSQNLPEATKPDIRERLRQLTPGEAAEPYTWPEFQHRIESLLAVGEPGLAREHLEKSNADIEHAPSEFRLGLFGLELQLLMKEKDWAAIDGATVPAKMDSVSARQAQDRLDFHKATSQLLRPQGDLAYARGVLQRLAAQPGAGSAYKENLFAVAIQQLLGSELRALDETNREAGESLLAEINVAITANESLVGNSIFANRALLLLALGRPQDALDGLARRRIEKPGPDLEHIAILAYFEMGFKAEAMAVLESAIATFGDEHQLILLKKSLEAGGGFLNVTSATLEIDPISSIRAALQQLAELHPRQVGDVLGPAGSGLEGYLIRQVSRAIASLQHMAGMLRTRKDPENEAKLENDLNTAVREVLGASLGLTKWDVADQSLGGFTALGNPGERDLVIRASGQEIAIYEAQVCSSVDRSKIKMHFDKLIGYGFCNLYFHVVYSYAQEVQPLLDYLKEMLEGEIPTGLIYRGCESLRSSDHEVCGYIANYRIDQRDVSIVFMIANLKKLTLSTQTEID